MPTRESLETLLHYQFSDPDLLTHALTHPSSTHDASPDETTGASAEDNQRLEFLGDAVLQLAVTEKLYEMFPNEPEGRLTGLRARLVNRTHLVKLAQSLELGEMLILGRGEEVNSGRSRASNLADAMEAVLGAIFRDGGWEKSREVILRLLEPHLPKAGETLTSVNPKGDLQELLQAYGQGPPSYSVLSESGPPHERTFEIQVEWVGRELARGKGTSKKEAETKAACAALEFLDSTPPKDLLEQEASSDPKPASD